MANKRTIDTRKQKARRFLRAYMRQRGLCIWCARWMWPASLMSEGFAILKNPDTHSMSQKQRVKWLRDNKATIEHICPIAVGGPARFGLPNDHPNLIVAHALCNERRGDNVTQLPHPKVHKWLHEEHKRAFAALRKGSK